MKEKQMVPREPGRGTLLNCGWHGEGGVSGNFSGEVQCGLRRSQTAVCSLKLGCTQWKTGFACSQIDSRLSLFFLFATGGILRIF